MTPYGSRWEPPNGLRERVAARTRSGFRVIGSVTAPLRTDPDYLLIGTKRGGTTSLARWLLDHPDIRGLYPAAERRKGASFFDVNYGRGHRWYRSHFPVRAIHERVGLRNGITPPASPTSTGPTPTRADTCEAFAGGLMPFPLNRSWFCDPRISTPSRQRSTAKRFPSLTCERTSPLRSQHGT